MTRRGTRQLVNDAATAGYTHLDLTEVGMISSAVASELLAQADARGIGLRVVEESIVEEMLGVVNERRDESGLETLRDVYIAV